MAGSFARFEWAMPEALDRRAVRRNQDAIIALAVEMKSRAAA
jgi:hypothetical protein